MTDSCRPLASNNADIARNGRNILCDEVRPLLILPNVADESHNNNNLPPTHLGGPGHIDNIVSMWVTIVST